MTNQPKGLPIKTTAKQDKKEAPGVISVDEVELKHHLSGIVRVTVEETLNAMPESCHSQRTRQRLSNQTSGATT